MRNKILGIALLSSCLLALALAALWFAGLQAAPATPPQPAPRAVGTADLERLHKALRQHDRTHAAIDLTQDDINQLLAHLIRQQGWPASAHVTLRDDGAQAVVSLDTALPRRWLNVAVTLQLRGHRLQPVAATVGKLPVPAALLPLLERQLQAQAHRHRAWPAVEQAIASIRQLDIDRRRVHIEFTPSAPLRRELAASRGALLFGPAVKQRLPIYVAALQAQLGTDRRLALDAVLPGLFLRARAERESGADATVDNRALLLALTLHSVPADYLQTFGGADLIAASAQAGRLTLTLHGRRDLAQHFLVSALLASYGDEALASRAGLYKELRDRDSASGFDATDLLADYAGMAFGALADSHSPWLQDWMRQPRPASAFMPSTAALSPEAVDALQRAAAAGDLETLQHSAEQHLLPLLLTAPLYRQVP